MAHPLTKSACLLATLAFLATAPLLAADDAAARRDREQLQRSRAALRAADEQRQALEAEKAGWVGERKRLTVQRARERVTDAQAAGRLKRELDQLRDEQMQLEVLVAALRDGAKEAGERARVREAELNEQLTQARRENAERTQLVRAVAGLLERSASAVVDAQASNSRMHAAGVAAIETFRREAGTAELSITDPLGFRAVRRENQSDALREALDKQRATGSKP